MRSRLVLLLIVFASISLFSQPVYAKPVPPRDLQAIFNDFRELEESFEGEKWDKALKETQHINDRFLKMLPELRKTVGAQVTTDFAALMENLKKTIASKNARSTLTVYIALQNMFFRIMDQYEYKLPPVIRVIDSYIDEALDKLRDLEYDEVVGEMEEIVAFVQNHAEKHLQARTTKAELDEFKRTLVEVKNAAKVKNHNASLEALKKLKKMSERFVKLFKT